MSFHLYRVNELYSNADGSIQFIEMKVGNFSGEGFWQGVTLSDMQGGVTHSLTFPTNLPSTTATNNTSVLIATQGFANLGIVTPDFIVPSGFLFTNGGTVNYGTTGSYGLTADTVMYSALPTDGTHAIDRNGVSEVNFVTDFAGVTGTVTAPGGAGINTAMFSAPMANFTIAKTASGFIMTDTTGAMPPDMLANVERLKFADGSVALDMGINQSAGETALLIGSVLGTASLQNKALIGHLLPYFDAGNTLQQAADVLVNSGYMASLAGGADSKSFVDLIFRNVVGVAPDATTEASLTSLLDSHQYSQSQFLAAVTALPLNQTHVNLTGLANTGMGFV